MGGEHVHCLFQILTKRIAPSSLAEEAAIKLSNDEKQKTQLERVDVLVVDEISLISADLWATMDYTLRLVRDSDQPFGGALVIADGDCCQLPKDDGSSVFQSTYLLFNFNFQFL